MRNRRGMQGVVWLLAGAALLIVAGTTFIQSRQSKGTAVNGRFTKTQILSQSEPLLQALMMGATNIHTVANPTTTYDATGQSVHHWEIDSTNPTSGDRAHLLWNADTGELVRAYQARHNEKYSTFKNSPKAKAPSGFAWDWFHALKIARSMEDWQIVGSRQKPYGQWDIYFRSGDRYTILTVKSDSGALVQVFCGHLPSANMVWVPFKAGVAS